MICVVRSLFNVPCPTCGCTRAMLALMRGDIGAYGYYNVMALPMALVIAAFALSECFHYKGLRLLAFGVMGVNLCYYAFRMYNGTIP